MGASAMDRDEPLPLDVARVQRVLRTRYVAYEAPLLVYVPSTGSTNSDARALALRGAAPGTVVVADEQRAGRGRLGRAWSVPARTGLTFSVLLRGDGGAGGEASTAAFPTGLVMAAGLAVYEMARAGLGLQPRLKWPNDVLLDGRKVAGILV